MKFPFFAFFILLLAVFAYLRKRGARHGQKEREDFWSRERRANEVRRQDISGLPYITIPFQKFPIGISDDEELLDFEADLTALKGAKILNLNGKSNTDLKLLYGPANLPALSDYDQNFARLARTLVAYASCLIKNGYETEALPVLEFGVEIGSDVLTNYALLADIYKRRGERNEIDRLIRKASALESIRKPAILKKLNAIRSA